MTCKLRIFRLCLGSFLLFFKQTSSNFAKDASQICVAAADFMEKVDEISMFGTLLVSPQPPIMVIQAVEDLEQI
jgi:hypothetical protein